MAIMVPNLKLIVILITMLIMIITTSCSDNHKLMKNYEYKIKGMFVFGSSLVDNGNNNNIKGTLSKVDYMPYGIDFPLGHTGRFSNGENVADCLGRILGVRGYLPPFANPTTKGDRIRYGVNFGSGGSGILDTTGSITGGVITLKEQINNFEEVTLSELKKWFLQANESTCTASLRNDEMEMQIKMLDKYLFLLATGNNDLGLNYFLQSTNSRPPFSSFVSNLTSTYATHLQRLYNMGARKFALLALYPLGCSPSAKQSSNIQQCVSTANTAAQYVNTQLMAMVNSLKQRLPGSNFVLINTYNIILDIINNPSPRGFKNVTGSCCELSDIMGVKLTCKQGGEVCRNRNGYVYFDGLHTSEAVNKVIAKKAFFSHTKNEAYPFNIQALAML